MAGERESAHYRIVVRSRAMKRAIAAALLLLSAACGGGKPAAAGPQVSHEPISVRGWIEDVDTGETSNTFRTVETEAARRTQNFQSTNIWVDGAPYVSGGVSETGAFVLLDVPPGKATISFSAPGVPQTNLVLGDIPGNADVVIPGLILRKNGVALADPAAVQVRVAAKIAKPVRTSLTAHVAGVAIPVTQVPINAMIDRRDYPVAPAATPAPVAKVR